VSFLRVSARSRQMVEANFAAPHLSTLVPNINMNTLASISCRHMLATEKT